MAVDISKKQAEDLEAESLFDLVAGASPAARRDSASPQAPRWRSRPCGAERSDRFPQPRGRARNGEPLTEALVVEACAFLRDHDVKAAVLQFAPDALPADWGRISPKSTSSADPPW